MLTFIQNIWSNLKKEPIVTLLFVFQIAITAFVIFVSCFEVKYASDQINSANNVFTNFYFYRFDYNPAAFEDPRDYIFGSNANGLMSQMDSTIKELKEIDALYPVINICNGTNLKVLDPLDSWDEEGCSKSEFSLVQASSDGKTTSWPQCFADKEYFNVFGIPRIESGRFFTDEEFNLTYEGGSVVPIILGYDFKKYCKIGDTFDAIVAHEIAEPVTVKVIGFVKENETYVDIDGNKLYSYDRQVILPFNSRSFDQYPYGKEYSSGTYFITFSDSYRNMILLVDKQSETSVLAEMNEILDRNGLSGKIYFSRPSVSPVSIANNYKENMNIRMALTYITVLFSFVSIVFITVNRISSNIRNYAIHLISGATYGNIHFYIIGEIALYSLIGFIIGSNAYGIRNILTNYINTMPFESQFGFNIGWIICLAMLVLFTLICFIIVVGRMRKIDLSSVLRDKVYADGGRGTVYKVVTVSAFAIISVCIIFAVSYFVHINSVDMYYRHFYTAHTKKVTVYNDPSLGEDVKITPQYKELGKDYVIDKFVTLHYSEANPYIRGTYYEGDVELPNIISGRYFNEEEMYGGKRRKVAVMGKKAYEDFATIREDGTAYFTYINTDYEVIGIAGKPDGTETRLDEWVFMPIDTVLEKYGETGSYFIDGATKKNIAEANESFLASLENEALTDSVDQTFTEVVIGPTDALVSLAIMIAINIIIVCIYYTDKKHYTVAVKKFIGYSKGMVFGDIFAGFLRWAAVGYGIGVAIIITILLTPLKDFIMFKTLSLNLPTILISFLATAFLALIFAAIAINRTYNRDTSEVLRG